MENPVDPLIPMGAKELTSLNLPPTIFPLIPNIDTPRRSSVRFTEPPPLLAVPLHPSKFYLLQLYLGIPPFNDPLYTVYNTPKGLTMKIPILQHYLEKNSPMTFFSPSIDLPSQCSINFQTCGIFFTASPNHRCEPHITEAPQSLKITIFFTPLGQKRKLKNKRGKKHKKIHH